MGRATALVLQLSQVSASRASAQQAIPGNIFDACHMGETLPVDPACRMEEGPQFVGAIAGSIRFADV
jgi:hypothetical protein